MLSKYTEDVVDRINARFGAGHRVKPYNLKNADDLKQALLVSVAAYRDYKNYRDELIGISDSFDESIEYCDTATWLDLENAPDEADELVTQGFASLAASIASFDALTERAKANLTKTIKAVLSAPSAVQIAVFGHEYRIAPKEIDTRINGLFIMLDETEYYQAMPENLNVFLHLMQEQWAA
jgi:hypothetical protein